MCDEVMKRLEEQRRASQRSFYEIGKVKDSSPRGREMNRVLSDEPLFESAIALGVETLQVIQDNYADFGSRVRERMGNKSRPFAIAGAGNTKALGTLILEGDTKLSADFTELLKRHKSLVQLESSADLDQFTAIVSASISVALMANAVPLRLRHLADCAFGLMRLVTALLGRLNRRSSATNRRGQGGCMTSVGEDVTREVREGKMQVFKFLWEVL